MVMVMKKVLVFVYVFFCLVYDDEEGIDIKFNFDNSPERCVEELLPGFLHVPWSHLITV